MLMYSCRYMYIIIHVQKQCTCSVPPGPFDIVAPHAINTGVSLMWTQTPPRPRPPAKPYIKARENPALQQCPGLYDDMEYRYMYFLSMSGHGK